MPAEVGTAYVAIMPSVEGFPRALNQQISGGVRDAGRHSGGLFGEAFKKAAAVLAGVGIVQQLHSAIDLASDLNESTSKTQVVFKKFSKQVIATSKTAAQAMGLSSGAYLEATSTLGNLLVALDVAPKTAANMSQSMVKLAGDLASFNNVPIEDALAAIKSGLVGEQEPLRAFGVSITDLTLHTEALRIGLIKNVKDALDPQAKALAVQSLIMKQTKTAQGDFTRTSTGLANAQRILAAKFDDTKARLGKAFLPVMQAVVAFLGDKALPAFEHLWNSLSDAAGPAIQATVGWFKANLLPVLKEVAAFVQGHLVAAWNFLSGVFTKYVMPAVKAVVKVLVGMWHSVQPVIAKLWAAFQQIATFVRERVALGFQYLYDIFVNHVVPAFKAVWKVLLGIFKGVANAIGPAVKWVLARLGELLDFLYVTWVPLLKWIFDFVKRNANWLVPLTLGVVGLVLALKALPAAMAILGFLPGLFNRAALAAGASSVAVAGFKAALLNIGVVGVGAMIWVVADAFKAAAKYSKEVATMAGTIAAAFVGGKAGIDATSTAVQGLINKVSISNPMFKELNKIAASTAVEHLKQDILDEAKALGITGLAYGKIKRAADEYAVAVKLYGAESGQAKLKLLDLNAAQKAAKGSADQLSVATKNVTKAVNGVPPKKVTKLLGDYYDLLNKVAVSKAEIAKLPKSKTTKLLADVASAEAAITGLETKLGTYAHRSFIAKVKTIYENPGNLAGSANAAGGLIRGPGTGTSDSIPARLSNGEYVMTAAATAKHLPLLEAMRSGKGLPGFALGGLVNNSGIVNGPNIRIKLVERSLQKVVEEQIAKGLAGIASSFFGAFGGGGSTYAGGGSLGQWIARALAITGHPDWASALYSLVMHESGGNPNAINNYDINAQRGDPSRGLAQTIMSTFQAYRDPNLPNNIYDPVANLVAAIHYMEARYGSIYQIASYTPSGFVGGYANGSNFVPRTGLAMVHQGEAVVPRRYNPAAGGAASSWAGSQDRTVEAFREAMRGMRVELDGQLVGRVQAAYSTRLARR